MERIANAIIKLGKRSKDFYPSFLHYIGPLQAENYRSTGNDGTASASNLGRREEDKTWHD